MNIGDLVMDDYFEELAIVLRVGTRINPDGVLIKFIESGVVHTTFKNCVTPLGGEQ
jgi:hypothetical protein